MPIAEHIWFNTLKKEIAETFRKTYPSCTIAIEEWKGQDITNFQEELILKVKGRISEKWFYTHIKSEGEKLPRIDMLNMLSQYAGYKDWRDFTSKQTDFTKEVHENEPIIEELTTESTPISLKKDIGPETNTIRKSSYSKRWIVILSSALLLSVLLFLVFRNNNRTYHCCITDLNGQALVPNSKVEVHLLKKHESPVAIGCDNNACFEIKTSEDQIQFTINSPYYRPDTIVRGLEESYTEEQIKLKTNDYALMIHYFSTSSINDWKQRRTKLEGMISGEAKIFQVYMDGSGMELFNKTEFINKLTMPLKSLKNIEVIETRYSGNQISLLRFIQNEQTK